MNSTPRSRRDFLQLLGVCAAPVAAAVPWALWRKSPQEDPLHFDDALLKRLQQRPSEVVLLGNSMIHGRMDPVYLQEIWKPLGVTAHSIGATRTLQWFLWLKNHVAASKPTPKLVFLFYRDYDFHNMGRGITDRLLNFIRQSMVAGDQVYLRRARREGLAESPRDWLDAHYKNHATRPHLSKKLSDNAYDVASVIGPKSDRELKAHLDNVFSLKNLRSDLQEANDDGADSGDSAKMTFNTDPTETLLGDFISLADQHQIKLVFYHVKRRPEEDNMRKVPPELQQYTAALKSLVEARGHYHINETEDPAITLAMYNDFDHLHPECFKPYTELFAARTRHLLPPQFTAAELARKPHAHNP